MNNIQLSNFYHITVIILLLLSKKVKFFHTRYQALGPELIPVYRQ